MTNYVIIPIMPKYAELIFSGKKTIEIRKNPLKNEVGALVLYATEPINAVVGFVEYSTFIEFNPQNYDDKEYLMKMACVDEEFWSNYYDGVISASAFLLHHPTEYIIPVPLEIYGLEEKDLNQYCYLDKSEISEFANREFRFFVKNGVVEVG